MKAAKASVWACILVGLLAGTASATVNIETVRVGDPANAAYTSGYGSVAYTYSIGKYEVTFGQYAEFLNAVAATTDPYHLYSWSMANPAISGIVCSGSAGDYRYSVNPGYENRPVNHVSYWDACRFTNWLSNGQPTGAPGPTTTERGTYTLDGYNGTDGRTIQRNPGSTWAVTSENEWYKAAYYTGGSTNAGYWLYPTRSDTPPGRDLNDASGNNANCGQGALGPIQPPYVSTVVGHFGNSASPYGTFDQGGNVWEWNESVVASSGYRGLRGGASNSDIYAMRLWTRVTNSPTYENWTHGFRVVQLPEPTTLAIFAFGAVALVRRR